MTWAGCYSLDLYCDNLKKCLPERADDGVHAWNEFPHQYTAELGTTCRKEARRDGWIVRRDGSCLCPKCSGKKKSNDSPASRSRT